MLYVRPDDKAVAQDNDEFWMYDELKTRVNDPQALRNKFVNGSATMRDKDSDKMIASRIAQASALCPAYHCLFLCGSVVKPSSDRTGIWLTLYGFSSPKPWVDYCAFSCIADVLFHSPNYRSDAGPHQTCCMLYGQRHVNGYAADLRLRMI